MYTFQSIADKTNDAGGGIGLNWHGNYKMTGTSAGDIYGCCGTEAPARGYKRTAGRPQRASYRVQIYGRHRPSANGGGGH